MRKKACGLIVLGVATAAAALAAAGASSSTVVLVRHAEKAAESGNPELTDAGLERARALARTVGDLGIDVIYSTPFRRTQQTVAPVALALALEVTVVEIADDHVAEMARRLRAEASGTVALYVGHSNTVPEIATALGCDEVPPVADDEYDTMWMVTFEGSDAPHCHHLRYGS